MTVHQTVVWFKIEHHVVVPGQEDNWYHTLRKGRLSRADSKEELELALKSEPEYLCDTVGILEFRIVKVTEEVVG